MQVLIPSKKKLSYRVAVRRARRGRVVRMLGTAPGTGTSENSILDVDGNPLLDVDGNQVNGV